MARIFSDTLQATDSSGLYTLMADVNGVWTDVHTISGAQSGRIEVDASINTIDVNTSVLIPGQSYDFKWVDSNGVESNVVHLVIPFAITNYAIGKVEIDFNNTGGDNYTIGFHAAPSSFQSLSGASIVSYQYQVDLWLAQAKNVIEDGTKTADYSLSVSGRGAGVYHVMCRYFLSDGSSFVIVSFYKVDGAGTTLASIISNGAFIDSVNGLTIDEHAGIVQLNCNYGVEWAAYDATSDSTLATSTTGILTLPVGTTNVAAGVGMDGVFTTDFGGDPIVVFHSVAIG